MAVRVYGVWGTLVGTLLIRSYLPWDKAIFVWYYFKQIQWMFLCTERCNKKVFKICLQTSHRCTTSRDSGKQYICWEMKSGNLRLSIKAWMRGVTYMRRQPGSKLVRVTHCRRFRIKVLREPMLIGPRKLKAWKKFQSIKMFNKNTFESIEYNSGLKVLEGISNSSMTILHHT